MAARRKKSIPMPDPPAKAPTHPRKGAVLADDLDTLQQLRDAASAAEAVAKDAKDTANSFERYVIDRMAYERVPSQRCGDRTYYVNHKQYAKIQDREAFVAWALENEPELLKQWEEKVGDLNTAVRRMIDDGVDLPDGVGHYPKTGIGSRAA